MNRLADVRNPLLNRITPSSPQPLSSSSTLIQSLVSHSIATRVFNRDLLIEYSSNCLVKRANYRKNLYRSRGTSLSQPKSERHCSYSPIVPIRQHQFSGLNHSKMCESTRDTDFYLGSSPEFPSLDNSFVDSPVSGNMFFNYAAHSFPPPIDELPEYGYNQEFDTKYVPWSNETSDVAEMMSGCSIEGELDSHPHGFAASNACSQLFAHEESDDDYFGSPSETYRYVTTSRRPSSPSIFLTLPEPTYCWVGKLAVTHSSNPVFSPKLFLGGLPRGISEADIINTFKRFGDVKLHWPKEKFYHKPSRSIQGYIYLRFESDKQVKAVLRSCSRSESNPSEWYYPIQWDGFKKKGVQVIPWQTRDNTYSEVCLSRVDTRSTVFVGALHGRLTARALFIIFNDLFKNVVYVSLDTDPYKYPIGSGRVTFNSEESYMKAVACGFVGIDTPDFVKIIQVDPYLEDNLCEECGTCAGMQFCRDLTCFGYYCETCWKIQHAFPSVQHHKALVRKLPNQ